MALAHRSAKEILAGYVGETLRLLVYGLGSYFGSRAFVNRVGAVDPQIVLVLGVPTALLVMWCVMWAVDWWQGRDRIEIYYAKWGSPGKWFDVKGALRNHIATTGIDVEVKRDVFGDPAKGDPNKVLMVVYAVDGGDPQDQECREYSRFTIRLT